MQHYEIPERHDKDIDLAQHYSTLSKNELPVMPFWKIFQNNEEWPLLFWSTFFRFRDIWVFVVQISNDDIISGSLKMSKLFKLVMSNNP